MTRQDWQRIRELFDRAVSLDGAERSNYVRTECRDNPELLTELEKLLAADDANRNGDGLQVAPNDRREGDLKEGGSLGDISRFWGNRSANEKKLKEDSSEISRNGETNQNLHSLNGEAHQSTFSMNGEATPAKSWRSAQADLTQRSNTDQTALSIGSNDDELPLALGSVVEGYSLEKVIGFGVSGIVYLATSAESKSNVERVAIKALYPWNFDRDSLLRYDREREALSRLHHPNVARFIRAGKTHCGVPYLAMELIEGRSLHDLIVPGDAASTIERARTVDGVKAVDTFPDLNQRVAWMIQIAEGVQMAHQKLILHRDLKPANVIINEKGDAVLTDFGLAKFLGPMMPGASRTSVGKIMGTPQYMAPEQVLAQEPTMATDVYGLGGVLYFLLTGRPPFDRPSFYETCEAVKNESPLPPSRIDTNVPRDLETICLKCLAREPEKRYRSVDALLMDLQSFSLGEPIAARSVSAIERLGYWARRNRLVASASAAMVVLGIVALSAIVSLWWKAEAATELAEKHLFAVQETNQQLLETIGGFSQSLKVVEKNSATLHMQLEWLTNINEAYEKLQPWAVMEPAIRHDAAVARYKLGLVQRSIGLRDLGSETLGQAEAMFRELAQEEPDNFKHWFDVFRCLTWRGQAEEAYQVMVKVDQMSGGENPVYRDALAHAELRRARDFLGMSKTAGAEELISRALGRVEANLRDDPENGLYWKKLAECHHNRARLEISKDDRVAALRWLEEADQAYGRAFTSLENDIQTLRQWLRNDGLRFSLHLDSGDWEKAGAVLKSSELRMALHAELVTDGIDYHLYPAMFQEQKFIWASVAKRDDELVNAAAGWLEAVRQLREAFPDDLRAQRLELYALQIVDQFLPEMELDSTIKEFRDAMAPLEEPLEVKSETFFLQMVAEYVAGNKLASETMAKAYIASMSEMTDDPETAKIIESEIPYFILDESEGDKNFAESKLDAATLTVLRNKQMSFWEDYWRHWFVSDFIFGNSERKQD